MPESASSPAGVAVPADTRIHRRGNPKRILVIGAGLSGLVAAFELMRAGHDVAVLEAQLRAGGRVLTLRAPFTDGLIAEAGAGRIPVNHAWTYHYIKQFHLPTRPFAPASLFPLVHILGKRVALTPIVRLAQHLGLTVEECSIGVAGIAQKYLGSAIDEVRAAGDITSPDWPPAALREFDRYTFPDFLRKRGASPAAAELLAAGALPKTASALMVLRVLAGSNMNQLEKIEGGNDRLPKALAMELGDKIIYGACVVGMGETATGVRATFLRGGTHHSLHADYLICTLPFSVLRGLELMPNFSAAKRDAIREMNYVPMVKVALQTPTRYWERQGLSGFAQTDEGSEVWSTAWDQGSPHGILQLYQEGPIAKQMDRMNSAERLRFAAAAVSRLFPEFQPDFSQATSYSWQLDEFARGAYAEQRPGQLYSWYPAVATPEGRVHFAGEHTSTTPAFMQGAISSGHRAAREVNQR